jgi:hypothetical protein
VLLIVTIIIIVATKKGGGDDPTPDPGPDPPGPTPPFPSGYNPYTVSVESNNGKEIRGYLSADQHAGWSEEQRSTYLKSISPNDVGVLDPRVILEGENNQVI